MSCDLSNPARLARMRDVLLFVAAVILFLMFLSAFAPAIAQVINPPPPASNGDMLASVWANGSADSNSNVIDHARANNSFPEGSGYLYFDGATLSWAFPPASGDMFASDWANGSADGNPNVVDNARYAGQSGSAGYAGNSAQWNGFDMPGDSGFTSYVAFLAHNEWGQLTWIPADSWRGPQGEQGPPGEMSAYTWSNGSSSGNPNVIDHASYADTAGNAYYWNGMPAPSSDGLLFYSSMSGLITVNDVVRQSGEQVVGADFVLSGSDQANVVVRGGYGGAHEQPGASITFGGSDAYNTPGQLTFDAGGITVSGQAGLDATRSWLGADGIINNVTITHGLITAWEQVPNP
ncbi:MAG: hypothetical protein NTY53_21495 [Kiritimatiellaeota bacterium]|nr:hypothetical protein [Kiritimatiellota bacterium]